MNSRSAPTQVAGLVQPERRVTRSMGKKAKQTVATAYPADRTYQPVAGAAARSPSPKVNSLGIATDDLMDVRIGWMDALSEAWTMAEDESWCAEEDEQPDPYDQMFSFTGILCALQQWGQDSVGEPVHWSL